MEIVLLGHMGRDEAMADRLLQEEHTLHVLGQWPNPGLVDKAVASGGQFKVINSIADVKTVANYVEDVEPDMFLTNFDDALAAGVIDTIKQRVVEHRLPDLLLPCPDQAAARIEWDKFYLRELINEIDPAYNPVNYMAETAEAIDDALHYFKKTDREVALKPRNLTGGKGVKVQGKHFNTYEEARTYAKKVLASSDQTGIEIQEKLEGHEFTLQLFTDGKTLIKPPATYDYPYREDGDEGPGTGGMGAFSMQDGEHFPFMTQADYDEAIGLMDRLLDHMRDKKIDYKGVLYPTFFKTAEGLKIVETNARGGDPELINILDLMEDDVDFGEALHSIATGKLAADSIRYKKSASAMVYLVSPDYGYHQGACYQFSMNAKRIGNEYDSKVRFAAAKRSEQGHLYTVGSSRTVGLSALGNTPREARRKIHDAIKDCFGRPLPLEFRKDIANADLLKP